MHLAENSIQPNIFHRMTKTLVATRPISAILARTLYHLDRPVIRLTRGRNSVASLLTGLPILTLTTTGAKTGKTHSVPLVGIVHEGDIILIASYFGRMRHPAWYHNLRANSQARVLMPGYSGKHIAREVDRGERQKYWDRAVAVYQEYS